MHSFVHGAKCVSILEALQSADWLCNNELAVLDQI